MDRELVEVEQPFYAQLGSMEWIHLVGSKWDPSASERESFREVFLVGQLGKYVPGSIWAYVLQMELGKRYGIARARVFAASLETPRSG